MRFVRACHRIAHRIAAASIAVAAAALPLAALAAEGLGRSDSERAIESRAQQLGNPSYAQREAATKALIDAGVAARPALERLLDDPDPEIRDRAEKILRVVIENDFRLRLDAFAADLDGKQTHNLPGWDQFRREIGAEREARAVFVAMQRAEPALWEALAAHDPNLSAVFAERCEEACSVIPQQLEIIERDAAIGSIATLFFLAGSADVTIDDTDALVLESLIQYPTFEQGLNNRDGVPLDDSLRGAPGFTSGMRTTFARGIYRRLLSLWLAREGPPVVAMHKLTQALSYDLKDGGVELSRKLLSRGGGPIEARPYALLTLGRWGGKDDLPLVEGFFGDQEICINHRISRRQVQIQVREVALAVAAHLTGQDLKSYGYERLQPNAKLLYLAGSLTLGDDAAKARAFKRWADWKALRSRGGQSGGG